VIDFTIGGHPAKWPNSAMYKATKSLGLATLNEFLGKLAELSEAFKQGDDAVVSTENIDVLAAIIQAATALDAEECLELACTPSAVADTMILLSASLAKARQDVATEEGEKKN
jgi:hypothetical protein